MKNDPRKTIFKEQKIPRILVDGTLDIIFIASSNLWTHGSNSCLEMVAKIKKNGNKQNQNGANLEKYEQDNTWFWALNWKLDGLRVGIRAYGKEIVEWLSEGYFYNGGIKHESVKTWFIDKNRNLFYGIKAKNG